MLVYDGIKSGFIDDVNLNKIVDKIYDKYKQFFGRTSESQLNSWKNWKNPTKLNLSTIFRKML